MRPTLPGRQRGSATRGWLSRTAGTNCKPCRLPLHDEYNYAALNSRNHDRAHGPRRKYTIKFKSPEMRRSATRMAGGSDDRFLTRPWIGRGRNEPQGVARAHLERPGTKCPASKVFCLIRKRVSVRGTEEEAGRTLAITPAGRGTLHMWTLAKCMFIGPAIESTVKRVSGKPRQECYVLNSIGVRLAVG